MPPRPKPRIVADTNIFVPAMVGATAQPPGMSASAGLIRGWRAGLCTLVVSAPLLAEYVDVMRRPQFGLAPARAQRLCAVVAKAALEVEPDLGRSLLRRDPDDNMVLLTAVAGRADLLVTDNTTDFAEVATLSGASPGPRYRGVRVVGLGACLDAIRAEHAGADRIMRRRTRW
ncbi:MAG: putative toxin-antitoxin system toxin component, PIN family [Gemmatimonadaceae bacterium]